jgi:hypothetical protein
MSRPTSPFKFLDAYDQDDRDIFFGRKNETNNLYQALSGVKHLLVYGPSGVGKTSLIECGLRNKFSDADWFALTIRRGADMTGAVFTAINAALSDKIPLDAASRRPLDKGMDFGQAVENLFGERYQPVYLLFDQFEELLISGSEEEKNDFFTRINQLVSYKTPCRVLLIIREEFIGHLSEFEPLCPSLFQHRFRVEKMRKEKVKEVIRCTLEAPLFHASFRVADSGQLADRLLSKLPDKSREIELAHVQVFLSELWERAAEVGHGAALPALHEGLVRPEDNLAGVLDGFLKKQLAELDKVYGEKVPLEALAAMISERHTKLQLSAEALQQELSDRAVLLTAPLAQLLQDLEKRRILRTLRSGEQAQYEISHDVLAQVVGKNRTEEMQLREKAREIYRVYEGRQRLFSREELDDLRPFERYLTLPDSLKKRIRESEAEIERKQQAELMTTKRRLRVVRGVLGLALIAALSAGYFAWNATVQKGIAETKTEEAVVAFERTKKEEAEKEAQRQRAEMEKQRAEQQAELAIRNEQEAQRQTLLAQQETLRAKEEQYNRLVAEAKSYESRGEYLQAIERYKLARSFARNTVYIDKAIENCTNFEQRLRDADGHADRESYQRAIEAYADVIQTGINLDLIRSRLKDIQAVLQRKLNEAQRAADALSFDPQKALPYQVQAEQYQQYISQIQNLLK